MDAMSAIEEKLRALNDESVVPNQEATERITLMRHRK
jgi:hypothetical protein